MLQKQLNHNAKVFICIVNYIVKYRFIDFFYSELMQFENIIVLN